MVSIGLFEIFLAFTCFFILRSFSKNDGLPKNFPFVGMLPHVLINIHRIHDYATEVLERSQCTFSFKGPWFTNMNILATVDPANIHYIMSTNFSNFPKGPEFKEIFDVLGDGIFNSDSDLWQNQRKAARSLINRPTFYMFLVKTTMIKVETGLICVLDHVSKQGIQVDLQDLFQRFTFDSTCMLVSGYDPGCLSIKLPQVRFPKALEDAEESIFYRHVVPESIWKLQRWLGIGEEKKMRKAKESLDNILFKYVLRKREEVSEDVESMDMLTSYIKESKGLGLNNVDDKFLRDTIINFMVAGRDTTSSALTWLFWLVSMNPRVETKIIEEIQSVIPVENLGKRWLFDFEQVKKFVYLHGAICEALRLYPPVPFQHKSPVVADTLPTGHRVFPKMRIMFFLYALGRMKSIWGEDCLEFKPERWISEKGGIKHEPSYKFLAFNAGPRTCIGKEVAFNQMKVVAATIMHNYHVRVVEGQVLGTNMSIILSMKNGLMVKVSSRWAATE